MIQKIILRDQVREYLQQEMLNRKIGFGERLSLAKIARKINVSVTPIREALTQLEQAGIVNTIANRGFFVPPLSIKEAQEIYPIISQLECMAVQQSHYTASQLRKLEKIQTRFENAMDPEQFVKLDLQFHQTLIEGYDNSIANRILNDLKVRVFFYELEYMNKTNNRDSSAHCHRQIIEMLDNARIEEAVQLLKENWAVSLKFIKDNYTKES